jgi:hypothetical protein
MSEIKIGDKIICVDDRNWTNEKGTYLFYQNVYTLLNIFVCEKCDSIFYDVGAKLSDSTQFKICDCKQVYMVGKGIHWAKSSRFKPYIKNFKNFCRKEIVEKIQSDIHTFIQNKEYEKAVDLVKRLEKIDNEL